MSSVSSGGLIVSLFFNVPIGGPSMALLVLDDSLLQFSQLEISRINQNETSFIRGSVLPSNVVFVSD